MWPLGKMYGRFVGTKSGRINAVTVNAFLYRARPRKRITHGHCDFSARLFAGKFAPTTVHTECGNSGCDSRNECAHAPSHVNRPTHRAIRFHSSIYHALRLSNLDGLFRIKLGVFQLQQLAFQFCPTCSEPVRNEVIFLRIPRETWAEFHDNKRTDWFTRNSSCDHRLKIHFRGNPATFRTNQFPASFVVVFGINGITQIAYTQSNANATAFVVPFAFVVVPCINRP